MLLAIFHRGCPADCRTRLDYQILGLDEWRTIYLERFDSPTSIGFGALVGGTADGIWKWNGLGQVFTPAGGRLYNLKASREKVDVPPKKWKYPPDFD